MSEYEVAYKEKGISEIQSVPFDDYDEAGDYLDEFEDDDTIEWAELRRMNDGTSYDVIGAIGNSER